MTHPLDRPVWNALTTRLMPFASGNELAVRFRADVNLLGAAADGSSAALAALATLVPAGDSLGTVEPAPLPELPGLTLEAAAPLAQMILEEGISDDADLPHVVDLDDGDAPDMLALATLTRPGPFLAQTHRLGGFVGVREGGQLIAMAGERMKVAGWSEVSAVSTHPDWRGRGLGGALTRVVARRIQARGEGAFLHVRAINAGAIALYERLGFRTRREVIFTTYRG